MSLSVAYEKQPSDTKHVLWIRKQVGPLGQKDNGIENWFLLKAFNAYHRNEAMREKTNIQRFKGV
jgi:hypothetical protein